MARRTLIDIDNKMIEATIEIGGSQGIDSITSRKIAKICGVTDPLIFVHFQTMDNIIHVAYERAINDMLANCLSYDTTNTEHDFQKTFRHLVNYFVEKGNQTKFLYNAIHSKYGMEVPKDFKKYYMDIITHFLPDISENDCVTFYYLTLESLLHFCVRVIDKRIEPTDKNLELAFNIIYGGYLNLH